MRSIWHGSVVRKSINEAWARGASPSTHGFATYSPRLLAFESQASTQELYWQQIPRWRRATSDDFLNYDWQTPVQLFDFLRSVLPHDIPPTSSSSATSPVLLDSSRLINDVTVGIQKAPMSVRLSPHILSLINWSDPLSDPLFRQFVPLGSRLRPDHPRLRLDSLDEAGDSPVHGLVHRYPDKALFLASSVCPVYCRFCTRSYSVGVDTDSVSKVRFLPIAKRWEPIFNYIERTPQLADVLVSGGDGYSLDPAQLLAIGRRLLAIPHVTRVRFASKGLAVCPSRIIDPHDSWAEALIELSDTGRAVGKSVSLQTHFNHPREITWVTEAAARRFFRSGVSVRNQTVLLNGVNSDFDTMSTLIHKLAVLNIQPYYVLQGDMVRGVEDLRTPLSIILALEARMRGTIAGFMTPNFIVTLPGGGGKRLACAYESYDRTTGLSRFRAPSSHITKNGKGGTGNGQEADRLWDYWDPQWSLPGGEGNDAGGKAQAEASGG
ncbi:hypothetical protein MMC26_001794 [Xylographa opegraphella]|nr:hypothetical protein [Xylographa opegraphella]